MEKTVQLYEGKAKKVYATADENLCIVSYKDDATAFNGLKKGTIAGKGVVNNRMSNMLMQLLEKQGVPTHYVEELSDRETVVKKVFPSKSSSATFPQARSRSVTAWKRGSRSTNRPSNSLTRTTIWATRSSILIMRSH